MNANNFKASLSSMSKSLRGLKKNIYDGIDEIENEFISSVQERMTEAKTPKGSDHKPLSQKYVERKRKKGLDTRIWFATGKSYQDVSAKKQKIGVYRIYFNNNYAKYPNKMRKVLGLGKSETEIIKKRLSKSFKQAMSGRR